MLTTLGGHMDWFKKHMDTVIILGAFATSVLWMNGKFNELEKDMAVLKTVLIMKQIMPSELATSEKNEKKIFTFIPESELGK